MSWIKITEVKNVPLREGRLVKIGQEEIALFNLGDRFAAIDNSCPHQGGPLCDGIVAGHAVVCPLHGWKISLDDGSILKPNVPVCVEVYPTKVENGIVLIDHPGPRAEKSQARRACKEAAA